MSEQLLSQKQVSEMVSFSRSYIYEMIAKGRFPKPKKFGRTSRWFKSDIEQWLQEKKEEHDYSTFKDACAHFDDIVWQYVRDLNLQGLSVAECIKEGERLQTKYKEKRDLANKKPFAVYL
jgi:excisionase family DNA binding protein